MITLWVNLLGDDTLHTCTQMHNQMHLQLVTMYLLWKINTGFQGYIRQKDYVYLGMITKEELFIKWQY